MTLAGVLLRTVTAAAGRELDPATEPCRTKPVGRNVKYDHRAGPGDRRPSACRTGNELDLKREG
jgi:hypothetical protein